MEEIDREDESSITNEKVKLPNTVVKWRCYGRKKGFISTTLLIIGIVAAIAIFLYDKDLYEKVDKRNRQMLLDYPEIMTR